MRRKVVAIVIAGFFLFGLPQLTFLFAQKKTASERKFKGNSDIFPLSAVGLDPSSGGRVRIPQGELKEAKEYYDKIAKTLTFPDGEIPASLDKLLELFHRDLLGRCRPQIDQRSRNPTLLCSRWLRPLPRRKPRQRCSAILRH